VAQLPYLARINILCTASNEQAMSNTFHIHNGSWSVGPGYEDLVELCDAVDTEFTAAYQGVLWTGSQVSSIRCYSVVDPLEGPGSPNEAVKIVNAGGTAGSAGSPVLPFPLCPVLSQTTAVASRRARGRCFLPSAVKSSTINGSLFTTDSAWWTSVQVLRDVFDALRETGVGMATAPLSDSYLTVYSETGRRASSDYDFGVQAVTVKRQAHYLRSRERGTT